MEELEEQFAAKLARFPGQDLTSRLLYKFLLAEIALQRGKPNVAASTYLELAKTTKDLRIIQRATEVALRARNPELAIQATTLWLEQEPESPQARQILTSVLVSTGKIDDARQQLQKILTSDGPGRAQTFLHLNGMLARMADKAAVLKLVQELAQPYPSLAEARYAVAVAAQNAQETDLAIKEVHSAANLKPGWENAANLEAQIIAASSPDKAAEFYRDFLRKYPKSRTTRMAYARALVEANKAELAKEQFDVLVKDSPQDANIATAVGVMALQLKDTETAERQLKRAVELKPREPDTVRMMLGQLLEDKKRYDEAEKWYRAVEPGEEYLQAQIKAAAMVARQNRLDEAREMLRAVEPQNNQQQLQLILAEAQMLRDAKAFQRAYDTLTTALERFPDTPDLLYDRAMVAEKMDRLDLLEIDLRQLIKIKPDHAHAYNALGYTLADRTTRHTEALELIEKALKLAPEDAFILDSLGWAQYRLGRYEDSINSLRNAHARRPDPEIAAHLGEVLWAQGKRDEALQVWRDSLKENPDNEVLVGTMKKFAP